MGTQNKPQLLDFVITTVLLLAAIAALLQSLTFSGRAGMWPLFVTAALLFFTALHLLNMFKVFLRARSGRSEQPDSKTSGG